MVSKLISRAGQEVSVVVHSVFKFIHVVILGSYVYTELEIVVNVPLWYFAHIFASVVLMPRTLASQSATKCAGKNVGRCSDTTVKKTTMIITTAARRVHKAAFRALNVVGGSEVPVNVQI